MGADVLPGFKDNDIIAALLILVLGVVLVLALMCLLLVVQFLRKGRWPTRRLPRHSEFITSERRSPAPMFTGPIRWIAVRGGNPFLVQAALGLHNPMPCSWQEGLSAAHERRLFISPPIGPWVLVMGSNLPEPAEDVDKCYRFLLDLSRKLGHVQFFSINRAVNHHAWVQAEQGCILRAYAWAGRTLWNQGKVTRAEMDLGLKCFDYATTLDRFEFGRSDPLAVNTERVPLLASRWSVDPTSIDARMLKEHQGIAGQFSRSRAH
jgi:hypothetical protein